MEMQTKSSKNGYLALVSFLAVVLIGAGCQKQAPTAQEPANEGSRVIEGSGASEPDASVEPDAGAAMPVPGTQTPEMEVVKTFEITGKNFEFSLKEIRVKKGDKVKIVFNDEQGFHDWVLDEFNARTPQLQSPNTASVEFVADKTGTFEYYCSVGQHRQMGMKGNLVVE
jgi:plastocyanin